MKTFKISAYASDIRSRDFSTSGFRCFMGGKSVDLFEATEKLQRHVGPEKLLNIVELFYFFFLFYTSCE